MGMSTGQVTFLACTARIHAIGNELEDLALQETSLTRAMRNVTQKYQTALNTKTLKWSNNNGVTYADLTYNNLMRPNATNANTPYLISDANGKIVLDSKYQKYAELISANGAPSVKGWEEHKNEILAELCGMKPEDIEKATTAKANSEAALKKANNLKEEVDDVYSKSIKKHSATEFIKNCFGNITGFNYSSGISENNCGEDYEDNSDGAYRLATDSSSAKARLGELLNQITTNVSQYLSPEDLEKFKSACSSTLTYFSGLINNAEENCFDNEGKSVSIEKDKCEGNICIRIGSLMDHLLGAYKEAGGSTSGSLVQGSDTRNFVVFKDQAAYEAYAAKQAEYEAAIAEYESYKDIENQVWNAEQETNVAFYEQLFTAVAEKGWVGNSSVSDANYLNEMLLNNQYFITTMTKDEDDEGKTCYEYDTDIATNFDKIFPVNDSDVANLALAEYEYEKSVISEKEARIDTRRNNLETELTSLNKMKESQEKIIQDDTERNFGLWA